jgi:hypothetical protein
MSTLVLIVALYPTINTSLCPRWEYNITFALNNGDTYDRGSRPGIETDGWDALRTLGLTQGGADNWHLWVLFHVLNAEAGGSGVTKGNLTPTTQQANHIRKWNKFERDILKLYIPPGAPIVVDAVNFNADVDYHSPGTFYWQETGGGTDEVETESDDYPKNISAQLTVTWAANGWAVGSPRVFSVNLDESDGLIPPEELTSVPGWQAYGDDAHTTPYDGTKP